MNDEEFARKLRERQERRFVRRAQHAPTQVVPEAPPPAHPPVPPVIGPRCKLCNEFISFRDHWLCARFTNKDCQYHSVDTELRIDIEGQPKKNYKLLPELVEIKAPYGKRSFD